MNECLGPRYIRLRLESLCIYWSWCSALGDFIISTSLGMGLSFILKVGGGEAWVTVGTQCSEQKREGLGSIPGSWIFLLLHFLIFMGWRLCGVLVQFGCYNTDAWAGWKICGALVQFKCYQHRYEHLGTSSTWSRCTRLPPPCAQTEIITEGGEPGTRLINIYILV